MCVPARHLIALAACGLWLVVAPACKGDGCGDDGADGVATGEAGEGDATSLVDEAYRFRIDARPGWTLVSGAEAGTLAPDAIAGARMGPGSHGAVIVEQVGAGVGPADVHRELLNAAPGQDVKVIAERVTTFGGHPAYVATLEMTVDGAVAQLRRLLVVRDGWAWQLVAVEGPGGADDGLAAAFFDAVTLLEGPVRPRVARDRPATVLGGPGWRVEGGVYESAATRLRVAPPPGWRLLLGDELAAIDVEAIVGLTSATPDAYVTITPRRAPAQAVERALEAWRAGALTDVGAGEERLQMPSGLSGVPLDVAVVPATEERRYESLVTFARTPTHIVRIDAWYRGGVAAEARQAIVRALEGVSGVDDAALGVLEAALEGVASQESYVEGAVSLRRGTFRDFERGVVWRRPAGAWRLFAGGPARRWDASADLFFDDPASGLRGMLILEPQTEPPTALLAFAEAVKDNLARSGSELVGEGATTLEGDVPGWWIVAAGTGPSGRGLVHRFVLGVTGDTLAVAHVFGAPETVERAGAAFEAPGRGLGFGAGAPFERRARIMTDRRLGWRLTLPVGSWRYEERAPAAVRASGALAVWEGDGQAVAVLAIANLVGAGDSVADRDALFGLAAQAVGLDGLGGAEARTEAAGLPGWRRSWKRGGEQADGVLFVRDETVYLVLAASADGGAELFDAIVGGFELID